MTNQELKDFLYKLSRTAYLLHHAVSDPVHNLESIRNMLSDLRGTNVQALETQNPWEVRAWVLEQIGEACHEIELKAREEAEKGGEQ